MSYYERLKQIAIEQGIINTHASNLMLNHAAQVQSDIDALHSEVANMKMRENDLVRRINKLQKDLVMANTQPYSF